MNTACEVVVEGIGFFGDGLPSLAALSTFLADGSEDAAAPARPQALLLAPNERRRAPDTVALALAVAQAACDDAGRDASVLPSVFASTHGDLAITDYMCETLAGAPTTISPTRFHNSVHNAAAGYWTIGAGCHAPATALSAWHGSFAQGLVEAAAQVACGGTPVLLVGYDASARGALADVSPSSGLLALALVLAPPAAAQRVRARLSLALRAGEAPAIASRHPALAARYAGNAMAPMLPLAALLATGEAGTATLVAGRRQQLEVSVASTCAHATDNGIGTTEVAA